MPKLNDTLTFAAVLIFSVAHEMMAPLEGKAESLKPGKFIGAGACRRLLLLKRTGLQAVGRRRNSGSFAPSLQLFFRVAARAQIFFHPSIRCVTMALTILHTLQDVPASFAGSVCPSVHKPAGSSEIRSIPVSRYLKVSLLSIAEVCRPSQHSDAQVFNNPRFFTGDSIQMIARKSALPCSDQCCATAVQASPRTTKKWFTGILLLSLLLAGGRAAQAQAKTKTKLPGEDWISLFNGSDLTGWTKVGAESWTVEDGLLHGKGLTKAYGYLETDKDYKDFQISLRFKCVGDGNSGVFFHTGFKPGSVDTTQGMQFEIDCNMMHHTAGVYGEDGRGWVVWPSPENEGVVRMGDWNDYLLEVVGNHYKARLNGVQMVDFTDPKPSSFDGKIALQLHSGGAGNMQFKDIWIRDLSAR